MEIEALRGVEYQGQVLNGTEFQGEVVSIVPRADERARTFPVNVRLKNPSVSPGDPRNVLLKPGMFARVTLKVGEVSNAVLVPKDALVLGRSSKTVWGVRPDADFETSRLGTAVPIPVATGESDEGWIQVDGLLTDGWDFLREGQLVIAEGNERINPTEKVRVDRIDLHHDREGSH